MMNSKMKKIGAIMIIAILLVTMCSVVYADLPAGLNPTPPNDQDAQKIANTVIGYIQFIGYAIAVGMLIYIGIKYMMSSAADKADLKKGAINYVIGAILVAGAVTIAGFLANIGKGLGTNNQTTNSTSTRTRARTEAKAEEIYLQGLNEAESEHNILNNSTNSYNSVSNARATIQNSDFYKQIQEQQATDLKNNLNDDSARR